MKRKVNIIALISLTAMSVTAASVGVLSWFETRVDVGLNDNITGVANGAYFADGDGSSAHPFIINTPRHLYNLAWLQYLGYFNNNLVGPASGPVYFALDENLQGPLNMGGLTIPPIGTTQFPFWGYFDGNNKTILNLKVDNVVDKTSNDHINKTPSAIKEKDALFSGNENDKVLRESTGGPTHYSNDKPVNVMGMFGQTDTIDPTDVDPHIFDFTLDSATISSSSSSLLVGVAAGYLDSKMSNVAVKGPSINITNNPSVYRGSSLSEYTLVGYATESFVTNTKEKRVTAQTPLVSLPETPPTPQPGSEFGASIPMKNVYEHLLDLHNSADPVMYDEVWNGTVGVDPENNLEKKAQYITRNGRTFSFHENAEIDSSGEQISSYTFVKRSNTNAYMYLYGEESGKYDKTVEGIVNTASSTVAFAIGNANGDHWLTYNGSTTDGTYSVSDTSNVANATKWIYDSGSIRSAEPTRTETNIWGQITAYHYAYLALNASHELEVRVGEQTATRFDWQTSTVTSPDTTEDVEMEDGTVVTVPVPGKTYNTFMAGVTLDNDVAGSAYLRFDDGAWGVTIQDAVFRYFKSGEKYLKANPNTNSITLVDSEDLASKWYPGTSGGWMVKSESDHLWYTLGMTINSYTKTIQHLGWSEDHVYYRIASNLVFAADPSSLHVKYNEVPASGDSFYLKANIEDLIIDWSRGLFQDNPTSEDYYFYLTINGNNVGATTLTKNDNPAVGGLFVEIGASHDPAFDLSFKTSSQIYRNQDWETRPTYFPLTYDGTNVSSKNTGYIVSGRNYEATDNFPGDIRVSNYSNVATQLSASLGGANRYSNLTVITHEKGEDGEYVAVKDEFNSLTNVPNTLSEVTNTFKAPTGENGLDLVRYEESRRTLDQQFRDNFSNVHGLHFMDAQIRKDRVVNIPYAHIFGHKYTDYPVPQDCIDFNLDKHGFITFYAGTYYPGNSTFFSLHTILRNADHSIADIKEISKIYENEGGNRHNKRYIYEYVGGGTNVEQDDEQGDLIFDMAWVTDPDWVNYAVYYFEIPVNSGEYALGSVDNADGAYLMYLDIGTALRNQNITQIDEDIVTENRLSTYDSAVDFKDASAIVAGKGGLTAYITIPASSN